MTNRSATRRSASRNAGSSRAEARRRARLANLDEAESQDEGEAPPAPRPAGSGLLQRLFPAAPALKGRPDPLAGFRYEGPLRPVVTAGYLLRQNPIAWLAPGLLYIFSWEIIWLARGGGDLALLALQLVQYVVIAAAGWFGWQRPWLFGAAAGLLGAAGFTVLSLYLAAGAGVDLKLNPGDVNLYLQLLFYAFIGAALGWYGGYLRRRLATVPPSANSGARRR